MKRRMKLNSEKIYQEILAFTGEEQERQETEVVELNLEMFKTKACPKEETHNHKHCMFYHNKNDRRREGCYYSSQICRHVEKGQECPEGDDCIFSHNYVEQLYRPIKYRTKFCDKFPFRVGECEYSVFCSFAHQVREIKVPLIHLLPKDRDFYVFHFKTVFCPFNQFEHDKSSCDYCHNWQDFRRPPQHHLYSQKECPLWQSQAFLMNYEDGCKHSYACPHSHGWKEHEYHPLRYQHTPCPDFRHKGHCHKGPNCPHFHQVRHSPHPLLHTGIFQESPLNRLHPNPHLYYQYQHMSLRPVLPQAPCRLEVSYGNKGGSRQSKQELSLSLINAQATFSFDLPKREEEQGSPPPSQSQSQNSLKNIAQLPSTDEQQTMQQLSESLENLDLHKSKLYNYFIETE